VPWANTRRANRVDGNQKKYKEKVIWPASRAVGLTGIKSLHAATMRRVERRIIEYWSDSVESVGVCVYVHGADSSLLGELELTQ